MAHRFDRITSDAARMNGQPSIRGMRLTVRRVVEAVAVFPDREELRCEYPELEDDDIRQALEYAMTAKVAQERHKSRPDPSPSQPFGPQPFGPQPFRPQPFPTDRFLVRRVTLGDP